MHAKTSITRNSPSVTEEQAKLKNSEKPSRIFPILNYRAVISIIAFLLFMGLLFYFVSDGGSILEVVESMLWYFAWPVGVFFIGFIIKKILYL